MESYLYLAEYYDLLMDDVDYNSWCSFLESIFDKYDNKPRNILDTACGTGNITIPMAMKGYNIWGVDISDEMLTIAESKARSLKQSIKFIKQDMTELTLNKTFDAVLCMCDGVNYIIEEDELTRYLQSVHSLLDKKGIFVFDISSEYKLSQILGSNTLFQEKDKYCYVWENNYFKDEELLEMRLNFFVPMEDMYKRMEEYHTQRVYTVSYLKNKLLEAGFSNIKIFDDLKLQEPNDKSERIFFAVQKL